MTGDEMTREEKIEDERGKEFLRLPLSLRVQHMAMFVSVLMLIVTGLPLKFAHSALSVLFFRMVGGVMVSGIIHRSAAAILIGVGIYHMLYVAFARDGRKLFLDVLPKVKDFTDVGRNLLYFFGFSKTGARFGRFSYLEKFDYWAVYWGMVIMIGSGLMLGFHEQVLALIPKVWLDAAREAHSDEALLATLAIIIWHFYNVHFKPSRFPMNMAWWTGRISEEEMIRDHPLEYEQTMAEEARAAEKPEPPAEEAPVEPEPAVVEEAGVEEAPTEEAIETEEEEEALQEAAAEVAFYDEPAEEAEEETG